VRDGEPDRPYFITSGAGAMFLGSLRNDDGSPSFPTVSAIGGGSIIGVPQLVSRAASAKLILVDASALGVTDGGLVLDSSQYASVELIRRRPADRAPSFAAASRAIWRS
jgi:hypothetical protein